MATAAGDLPRSSESRDAEWTASEMRTHQCSAIVLNRSVLIVERLSSIAPCSFVRLFLRRTVIAGQKLDSSEQY